MRYDRWIDCSNYLPDQGQLVLIHTHKDYGYIFLARLFGTSWTLQNIGHDLPLESAIMWLPVLPPQHPIIL